MNNIHNGMDIIDSRDIIARLRELEDAETAARETAQDHMEQLATLEAKAETESLTTDEEDSIIALSVSTWTAEDGTVYAEDFTEDELSELKILRSVNEEGEGYAPDWNHGEALIRDSYFEAYARELAEDIGAIDRNAKWPLNHIDWEAAAEELKQDYTSIDFDGVDYWVRS